MALTFPFSYAYRTPLLIKTGNENSRFRSLCRKDSMLKNWGDAVVTLSSANTYSYGTKEVSLKDYIRNMIGPQSQSTLANGKKQFGSVLLIAYWWLEIVPCKHFRNILLLWIQWFEGVEGLLWPVQPPTLLPARTFWRPELRVGWAGQWSAISLSWPWFCWNFIW